MAQPYAQGGSLLAPDSDGDSSEDFQPAPEDVRIETALAGLNMPIGDAAKAPCLTGRWMIQQNPPPCETSRFLINLKSSGPLVEGTAEVAQMRDSTQLFTVDIKGSVVSGPVVKLTQTLVHANPPIGTVNPRQWIGQCHVFVDPSSRYFSGTYQSGSTTGVISGALTPDNIVADTVQARKWPPPPVPLNEAEQTPPGEGGEEAPTPEEGPMVKDMGEAAASPTGPEGEATEAPAPQHDPGDAEAPADADEEPTI